MDKTLLAEAIDLLEENGYTILDEDFGMGVGGPMGLDQGIPHGGDCKGCCPQRMGLYQRSPFSVNPLYRGVPDAHHPNYWLNQIPKKKKKKKYKKRKKSVNENIITDFLSRNDKVYNPLKKLYTAGLELVKKFFADDPDVEQKYSDAYSEALSYDRSLNTTANMGKTVQSDDPIHIFGRQVAHLCSHTKIETNRDYQKALDSIKMSLRVTINRYQNNGN